MPESHRQGKEAPARYATLLKHLVEGKYNGRELAARTGMHYITVMEYCRALHAAGLIYVDRWERDAIGREAIMIYKFGPGLQDVPRQAMSRTEQQRRYRARKAEQAKKREEALDAYYRASRRLDPEL